MVASAAGLPRSPAAAQTPSDVLETLENHGRPGPLYSRGGSDGLDGCRYRAYRVGLHEEDGICGSGYRSGEYHGGAGREQAAELISAHISPAEDFDEGFRADRTLAGGGHHRESCDDPPGLE